MHTAESHKADTIRLSFEFEEASLGAFDAVMPALGLLARRRFARDWERLERKDGKTLDADVRRDRLPAIGQRVVAQIEHNEAVVETIPAWYESRVSQTADKLAVLQVILDGLRPHMGEQASTQPAASRIPMSA